MATHLCDADMAILIREARRWIVDAGFYTEAEAADYGDGLMFLKVDRLYDGGWLAFERDNRALIEPDPLGAPGYYMQCGGCDAEMFVTEAQWSDTGLRVIEHVGCAHQGGVDLDHARRHSD